MRRPKPPEVNYSSPWRLHTEGVVRGERNGIGPPFLLENGLYLYRKHVVQLGAAPPLAPVLWTPVAGPVDTWLILGSSSFLGLSGLGGAVTTCSVPPVRWACGPAVVTFPDVWKNATGQNDVTRDTVCTGCRLLPAVPKAHVTANLPADWVHETANIFGSRLDEVGILSLVTPELRFTEWVLTTPDIGLVQKTYKVDKKYICSHYLFSLHGTFTKPLHFSNKETG